MSSFDPNNVNLHTASKEDILCYLEISDNEYNGQLGARISAIFIIGFVSSAFTVFPVISKRLTRWKIPFSVYIFPRYFGTGVIVATVFIHLLDPAYERIGPNSCVSASGYWGEYPWYAAIVLASVVVIFLMDLVAEVYVEYKYGVHKDEEATNAFVQHEHHLDVQPGSGLGIENAMHAVKDKLRADTFQAEDDSIMAERSFRQQIAAFCLLEFGIIFHSVIIGLNLGVTGSEIATLYPVLVFRQSFEGLGIGARMSAIPFGKHTWLPWILCAVYGLTTPISIAIGLGLRTTYSPESKGGVFDCPGRAQCRICRYLDLFRLGGIACTGLSLRPLSYQTQVSPAFHGGLHTARSGNHGTDWQVGISACPCVCVTT